MTLRERLRLYITSRAGIYKQVFLSPVGRVVLADLAKFCRANESTFHPDPHLASKLDGRREVFLRIQQHLSLSPDEIMRIMLDDADVNHSHQKPIGDNYAD